MKIMDLEKIVEVASRVFDEQTYEDLQEIQKQFGKTFSQAKIIANIAVGMLARIAELDDGAASRSVFDPMEKAINSGVALMAEKPDVESEPVTESSDFTDIA